MQKSKHLENETFFLQVKKSMYYTLRANSWPTAIFWEREPFKLCVPNK